MAYFDKSPGRSGETKEKNTVRLEDNSSSNRKVDERLLRLKMKQLVQKEFFHQIEPVEVIEVIEESDGSGFGKIIGRYIYSEYNISKGDARVNGEFKPINSNIIQMPLPGELVIGMEFNDSRYYFSALNPNTEIITNAKRTKDVSIDKREFDKRTTLADIDREFANVSNNIKGVQKVNKQNARIAPMPEVNKQSNVNPGDTIIQGRHNNYIQLSSNQSVKRYRGFDNPGIDRNDSGNVFIGAHTLETDSNSIIHLTTNEQPMYDERIQVIGSQMELSNDNRYKMKDRSPFESKFTNPSIFMKSDRIVMYAKEDDIAIFAGKGNVHIKGTKVQIKNSEQVSISSKSFSQQVQTTYRLKEDLKSGNVLLLPSGIVERGSKLARDHRQNILEYIQTLNSLIPAAIPGTRSTPNPLWFKNIKVAIKNAKTALETNKLIVSLKWLDFDDWKTYTIDELREAFNPIPGMADVLSKLSNLTDLVEEVDKLKEDYEVAKAQFEEFKAIAENLSEYFETLIYSKLESLTIDDFIQMEATLNDFEANGGDLSSIANGPELKQEAGQLKSQYEAIAQLPFEQQEDARKAWRDDARKFKEKCQGGFANGFSISIAEKEIDVSTKETAAVAGEALSKTMQSSGEAQKNL